MRLFLYENINEKGTQAWIIIIYFIKYLRFKCPYGVGNSQIFYENYITIWVFLDLRMHSTLMDRDHAIPYNA